MATPRAGQPPLRPSAGRPEGTPMAGLTPPQHAGHAVGARPTAAWPLLLARASAWALLISAWVGVGALAVPMAPSTGVGVALVALWLLALGAAAALPRVAPIAAAAATRGGHALAMAAAGGASALALWSAPRGGGMAAVLVALLGWAALTALASGVVRALRQRQSTSPRPPVAAAALGAACAGLVVGDPADLLALSARLAVFALVLSGLLWGLRRGAGAALATRGCRAGLFDCSLPAWPEGAWRDPIQWPTLLAGLAMLPMMAALPLMAAWCSRSGLSAQAMVLLHLGAMFGPVWLLNASLARCPLPRLAALCALLLAAGGAAVLWAPSPWEWAGLAVAHGTAWGLAWGGLLWAPTRRGAAGSSPFYAAAGYAVLTLAFGLVIEHEGPRGVAAVHAGLAAAAIGAWLVAALRLARPRAA